VKAKETHEENSGRRMKRIACKWKVFTKISP
jgi:hypothetical protein